MAAHLQQRRRRIILENLTAYAFLFPAGLIIFIFGLFPVAFAFFVSLHRWRRFPDEYLGLEQYVDAIGSLAYVLFFWLAIGAIAFAGVLLWRLWNSTERRGLFALIPGALIAWAFLQITNWFFILLPLILTVPVRLRGQQVTTEIFVNEFFNSFRFPEVLTANDTMWLSVIVAVAVTLIFWRFVRSTDISRSMMLAISICLLFGLGVLTMQLTLAEIEQAVTAAQTDGESLPIWTHIILISAGAGLVFVAYKFWGWASATFSDRRFWLLGLAVIALVIGGYALISQIPPALSAADDDVLEGFNVTVMYVLGTVPFQLIIGLGLAVLLFQNIRWKGFFRIVYFLPYITPFVATSVVFTLLFSHRSGSPANRLLGLVGIQPQTWLLEPQGIFQLIFGNQIPEWLVGPGLALVVIMIYNTWIYAGYSTVIFLAGLGNIPRELYEAARIDGATNWRIFRHVTLPLLSPTTFFLVLVATIGTFQAFTQIWLLRKPGALDAVDTINIKIFEEIRAANPDYAYGSAMAFVLFAVILVLTLTQNRIAERRVFYG